MSPKFCIIELLYWVLDNEFLTSEEESTLGIFKVKVAPPVKSIPGLSPPKIIKIKPIIIIRLETLKKDNLYFERLKEELRLGRTLPMAVNMGFSRAWPAIRDSNVSTLITCLILFWFADQLGATIVKGFAVTLSIGVIISMLSALLITQTILKVASHSILSKLLFLYVPSGRRDIL